MDTKKWIVVGCVATLTILMRLVVYMMMALVVGSSLKPSLDLVLTALAIGGGVGLVTSIFWRSGWTWISINATITTAVALLVIYFETRQKFPGISNQLSFLDFLYPLVQWLIISFASSYLASRIAASYDKKQVAE